MVVHFNELIYTVQEHMIHNPSPSLFLSRPGEWESVAVHFNDLINTVRERVVHNPSLP